MKPIKTVNQLIRAFRRIQKRRELGSQEESDNTYKPLEKPIEPEVLEEIGCTDDVTGLSGWQRFRMIGPFLRVYLELKKKEKDHTAQERLRRAIERTEKSFLVGDDELHFDPGAFTEVIEAGYTQCLLVEIEGDILRFPLRRLKSFVKEASDCALTAVFLDTKDRLHISYRNGQENPGYFVFDPQNLEVSPEDPVIHVTLSAVTEIPEETATTSKSFIDMLLEETASGIFSTLSRQLAEITK